MTIRTGPIAPGLHFTWEEAWRSRKHRELELANRDALFADERLVAAVEHVAIDLAEPVRRRFGVVEVHSWFRGPALNVAAGGSVDSQHLRGQAIDFHCPGASLLEVARWIEHESGLAWGQLLVEPLHSPADTWLHLSLGAPWRSADRCGQVRY